MGLYEAAIKSYQNVLKEYPDTDFKEDILFDILKSYYNYAGKSISHKQTERYQSALDSYNEFAYSFPDSKYMKEAKNMRRNVLAALEEQGAASSQNNNKQ
jgi:outer membrane protein assembly factor BamD